MSGLTIWERIILHLGRYDIIDPNDSYNAPWDLTQDGVASSLRISRAHASIELKKLKTAGKVEERFSHVKSGRSKRKAYFLTPLGMADAERIKGFIEEEGMDFVPLLDVKKSDPNAILESLDEESRFVLGLASVLRSSIKRNRLPETKLPVVPADVDGYIALSDDVKKKVISVLDEKYLSELHSAAADIWLSAEPDRQERLYHLTMAGRTRDACRLLVNDRNEFIDSIDKDLMDILSQIDECPEKYEEDVLVMKIIAALEFRDHDSATEYAKRLMTVNEEKGMLYMADIELSKGDTEGAISILNSIKDCSDHVGSDLRMAGCLASLSRYEEAIELLENTKKEMNRTGNLSCLNDVYLLLSTVLIKMGSPDEAIAQLNKAKSSAGERDKGKIFLKLSEAYAAKGLD